MMKGMALQLNYLETRSVFESMVSMFQVFGGCFVMTRLRWIDVIVFFARFLDPFCIGMCENVKSDCEIE